MIRRATGSDFGSVVAIRDNAGDTPLSDPQALTETDAAALIADGAVLVWEDADGTVAGFAASDAHDGSIPALLVAPGQDGRGIGRALLDAACARLRAAGHRAATLRAAPSSPAERHYRRAGWTDAGIDDEGRLILRKPL